MFERVLTGHDVFLQELLPTSPLLQTHSEDCKRTDVTFHRYHPPRIQSSHPATISGSERPKMPELNISSPSIGHVKFLTSNPVVHHRYLVHFLYGFNWSFLGIRLILEREMWLLLNWSPEIKYSWKVIRLGNRLYDRTSLCIHQAPTVISV